MKWSKERIFELRKKLGLSQSRFAELLNTSGQLIWCWETGRRNPSAISRKLLSLIAGEEDISEEISKRVDRISRDTIKAFRERLCFSKTQFAKRLGLQLSTISRWESGETSPDPESRRRLKSLAEKEGIDLQKLKEAKK